MASPAKINRFGNEDKNISPNEEICELEHLRKLFIGGLAPTTNEDGLKEWFSQFGEITEVVVMRDQTTNKSRGFGFVTYAKAHMIDTAQENRPHIIDKKAVEAKRVLLRPERETNVSVRKLFVGGIKESHDEECLKEYFSTFGNVLSVKILTDKNSGKRRGFAYIEFDDYDAVDKAVLQKPHTIKYVVVDVKKSVYQDIKNRPPGANNMTNDYQDVNSNSANKLFIGGLKEVHDQFALKEYFSRFGQVVSVNILSDKNTGKRRGFAFVEFTDSSEVERVISQKPHTIRNISVDVKKSVYQDLKNGSNNVNASGGGFNNNGSGGYNNINSTGGFNTNGVESNDNKISSQNSEKSMMMPPPNFNFWGPPPQNMNNPNSGNYQGPSPHNWNWFASQWGCPPPGMFSGQMNGQNLPNFGGDYQQEYNGGPTKSNNLSANKMFPYNLPSNSNYGSYPMSGNGSGK